MKSYKVDRIWKRLNLEHDLYLLGDLGVPNRTLRTDRNVFLAKTLAAESAVGIQFWAYASNTSSGPWSKCTARLHYSPSQ